MIGDVAWLQQPGKRNYSLNALFGCRGVCCPPPPTLLYCSAVNSNDSASFSDSSESSFSVDGSSASSAAGTAAARLRGGEATSAAAAVTWKDRLLKVSNYASLLCVIDCTVLPVITLLLPLFGLVAASPAQMEWMHAAGHQVALYFVLPVGLTATTTNYFFHHRKLSITAPGWLGLLLVLVANAGCSLPFVGHHGAVHHLLHALHHGVAHRVTNLVGCALLIASNYVSRRQEGCAAHGPNCDHTH